MYLLSVKYIIFEILGYPISLIELLATLSGLLSVYFATTSHILTWSIGIVNEIAFMVLFYQLQLYSDMLLQVYFMIATFYGWKYWKDNASIQVNLLTINQLIVYVAIILLLTTIVSIFMSYIHELIPVLFPIPASYPWIDAFVSVVSIVATILLARKSLATWYFWIVVDLVSIVLYLVKGVHLIAIEYFIFLILAVIGLVQWKRRLDVQ